MGHNTSKATRSGLWTWLDRVGLAVEYDPREELQSRVSRLEHEIALLRQATNTAVQTQLGDPKR